MALRILLHSLQAAASKYKRIIVPLVSCSIDFYVRIFLRVYNSPQKVKAAASKSALVYSCSSCRSYHLQPIGKTTERQGSSPNYGVATGPPVGPLCEFCGHKFHVS
jgi:tRNA (guanine26-N2/guanine27-N2)-dimethyltransferase